MLSYKESLEILKETNALIDGHFILSSGLHSPQYVQCAQLLSKPKKASQICNSLAKKIEASFKNFDLIFDAEDEQDAEAQAMTEVKMNLGDYITAYADEEEDTSNKPQATSA